MTALTSADRALITRARTLADLTGPALREHTRLSDTALAQATALGECQHVLRQLADLIERPGGDGEDARRLDAIRGVLARFDWEHHDRQLALEAIDRIADGGQP